MAGTAKRLRPSDLQTLQQFKWKRLRASMRDAFFLAVCLGIVTLTRVGIVLFNKAGPHTIQFNAYLACILGGLTGLYLALAPLCSLFIRLFNIHALPRVLQWHNILLLNLYLLASIPLAWLITTTWKPFRLLHTDFFGDIASACFCVAVAACILLFVTRRVLPLPRFSQGIRQIIIGISLALILSFAFGLLIPSPWLSFRLENTRLWQSSILFAMLWPIFLLHEGVVHNWAEKGTLPAFLLSLSARMCLLVIVYIFAMLSQEENFLELLWPTLVGVFLVLQRCSSLLYRKGRAAIAGATLSACIMTWVLTSYIEHVIL